MHHNSNVHINIHIDNVEGIIKQGPYIVIKPVGYKNRIAITPEVIAQVASWCMARKHLKVKRNG
jgi:hypothetical protein